MAMPKDRAAEDETAAELRARLETYELALQSSGIGTWEWLPEGRGFRWSRSLEVLMGTGAKPFDGRYSTFLSHVHPDDLGYVQEAVASALVGERPYDVEFRLVAADGTIRWMHTRAVIVRAPDGSVERVVGTQTDIDERRIGARRLRETTDLLEYVLETSPLVLFAGAVDGEAFLPRYVSANSERVQGWSAEALLSGAIRWVDRLHPDDAPRVLAANAQAIRAGTADWETRLRRPDGGYIWVRSVLRVRRAPDGAAAAALTVVERAAGQATALVQQLLAFSRRQELLPVDIGVAAALRGTAQLLATTVGEQVDLTLHVAADVGRVQLAEGNLERTVLNLALNARDAMTDGGALVITAARAGEATVRLCVTDTGSGMTADMRARAFEPFFTTKPVGRGRDSGSPPSTGS